MQWATRWKPAVNPFAITVDGQISSTGNPTQLIDTKVRSAVNRIVPVWKGPRLWLYRVGMLWEHRLSVLR